MLQRQLHRSCGEATEALTFQQLGEFQQRVFFIVDQKQLLAWGEALFIDITLN
ncbi:hypothetical protein ACMGG8_00215 [Pseudomonas sp. BNK-45]|uniref:hypothetical protein n=1 Tax=Pseudomonas sp. BNK-45 TaxID=3376180 RepID=UPI0039BFE263